MTPAAVELDCRGLPCPRPVIELAKAISQVGIGEVLAVVADDPAAAYDVPAWCRMRQQEFLGTERAEDGTPRHLVRRLS